LSGSAAFSRIFQNGKRFRGQFVQLVIHTSDPLLSQPHTRRPAAPTHYAIIVGRKVLRRAVDRNRFKRKARLALRDQRTALIGYDVLVCAKSIRRDTIDAAVAETVFLLNRAVATLPALSAATPTLPEDAHVSAL
jgi:ribonuclease P protein component